MLEIRRTKFIVQLQDLYASWIGALIIGLLVSAFLCLAFVFSVSPNFYRSVTVWDALLATRAPLHQLTDQIDLIRDATGADSVQLYSYHRTNGKLLRGKFNINVGTASAAGDIQDYEITQALAVYWQQWETHANGKCWNTVVEDLPVEARYTQVVKQNGRYEVASCPIGKLGYVAASWNRPMPFEDPNEAIAQMAKGSENLWALLSPPLDL